MPSSRPRRRTGCTRIGVCCYSTDCGRRRRSAGRKRASYRFASIRTNQATAGLEFKQWLAVNSTPSNGSHVTAGPCCPPAPVPRSGPTWLKVRQDGAITRCSGSACRTSEAKMPEPPGRIYPEVLLHRGGWSARIAWSGCGDWCATSRADAIAQENG